MESRITHHFEEVGLVDLSSSQANILVVLFNRQRAMSARSLARALSLSEATVCRLVKTLLRNDWVSRERHPTDGRAWLLEPTAKARDAIPKLIEVSDRVLSEAFGATSLAETEALAAGLKRLLSGLSSAARLSSVETPPPEADGSGDDATEPESA